MSPIGAKDPNPYIHLYSALEKLILNNAYTSNAKSAMFITADPVIMILSKQLLALIGSLSFQLANFLYLHNEDVVPIKNIEHQRSLRNAFQYPPSVVPNYSGAIQNLQSSEPLSNTITFAPLILRSVLGS